MLYLKIIGNEVELDGTLLIYLEGKSKKKSKYFKPLIAVPSSYSIIKEEQLRKAGFSMVIYANQLLRASVITVESVLKSILKNSRSYETEKNIMPIKEILNHFIDFFI